MSVGLKLQLLNVVHSMPFLVWISSVKLGGFRGKPYVNLSQTRKQSSDQTKVQQTRPHSNPNPDQIETDADRTHQIQTKSDPIQNNQATPNFLNRVLGKIQTRSRPKLGTKSNNNSDPQTNSGQVQTNIHTTKTNVTCQVRTKIQAKSDQYGDPT